MRATAAAEPGIRLEDVPLLAAIVLLPWAFGGVELWAFRSAAGLIAISGAVALARHGWAGWGLRSRGSWWLLPAFGLLAWAAIQIVPLPGPVLERVSPGAYRLYEQAAMIGDGRESPIAAIERAALARVPEVEGVPAPEPPPARPVAAAGPSLPTLLRGEPPACLSGSRRSISLEPSATFERATWFAALLLAFLLVRARTSDPSRATIYLGALAAGFVALAVVGLLQSFTWNGKLLWLRGIPSDRRPFGPYVNTVHFGGAMELGVPMLAGLALERWRRWGREALGEPLFVFAVVGTVACSTAIIVSASKAPVVLAGGALLVLLWGVAADRRARFAILGGAALLAVAFPLLVASTELGARLESFVSRAAGGHGLEGRGAVWTAGIPMLREFALTGSGFGSFEEVFPRFQPAGSVARWTRAHNDYLELVLEGGAVAGVLTLWLVVAYGRRLVRRLVVDGWPPWRTGLALGVVALAAHATLDFNHQIPANALLFVAIAALAGFAELDDEPGVDEAP